MTDDPRRTESRKTGLYDLHVSLGARMVPFAGWDMPVQFPMGVMAEHLHTRAQAGLFDVSHMGQVLVTPRDGNLETAALALESLIPADVLGLPEGRQRYGLFTNDAGGILDDLMFANRGDHFLLVVNAAMIGLTAMFLGGFVVDGLWAGIGAAIVTGVVSWIAGALFGGMDERRS